MDLVSPLAVARPQRRAQRRAWLWRALMSLPSLSALPEGFALAHRRAAAIAPPLADAPAASRHIVRAVLHAHTTYSDGRGSVPDVASAARRAGAEVLVLADHDTLQALDDGWERHVEGVLVLIGAELRTEAGYVLALGLPSNVTWSRRAELLVEQVRHVGGLAFTALPGHPCVGWRDQPEGVTGLEVLNLHSLGSHAASLAALPLFGWLLLTGRRMEAFGMLTRRPHRELAQWDALLARGRAVGLASADAHGQVKVGHRHVEIPRYDESFSLVQTHLVLPAPLTGDREADRETVLEALRRGACRMVYGGVGEADSVCFHYQDGACCATEGEDAPWSASGRFVARSRHDNTLFQLFHEGRIVGEDEGRSVCFEASGPGAYRLEVSRFSHRTGPVWWGVRPWIYTNPVYLT